MTSRSWHIWNSRSSNLNKRSKRKCMEWERRQKDGEEEGCEEKQSCKKEDEQ